MKKKKVIEILFLTLLTLSISLFCLTNIHGTENKFSPISPQKAVKNMSPGWNLGNTLESIPTEGSWGNPPVEEYTFDDIKKSCFRTVRIPVTWYPHLGPAPDYKVDPKWFDRVEQVVDWALKRDFYVIIEPHHDSEWVSKMAIDPETGKYVNDYDNQIIKFEKLWKQIAERFKGKSEKLILEVLNEPNDGLWDKVQPEKPTNPNNPEIRHDLTSEQMNDITKRILKIIRSSGGYNDKRLVIVCGLLDSIEHTIMFFKMPDDKYIILTVHYYLPWDFVSNWQGKTTWGKREDKKLPYDTFKNLYEKFVQNGLPIVMGEWGTLAKNDKLSRWYYNDYIAKTAHKYGMACILWDNGSELYQYFDRQNRVWRDEILKDVTVNACKGIPNSFIFPVDNYFKVNTEVTEDLTVKLELNGNELIDIYNGEKKLVRETDYIVDTQNLTVTIKKDYLIKVLESGKIGTNAVLKFDFSKGVDMPLYIIRYDLPRFPESTMTIDLRKGLQSDIVIPVSFNSTKLAKVSLLDKTQKNPIIESWTPYLNMDEHFDYNDTEIILKKNLLNNITTDSLLTFEFWPEDVKVEVEALAISPYLMFVFPKDTP